MRQPRRGSTSFAWKYRRRQVAAEGLRAGGVDGWRVRVARTGRSAVVTRRQVPELCYMLFGDGRVFFHKASRLQECSPSCARDAPVPRYAATTSPLLKTSRSLAHRADSDRLQCPVNTTLELDATIPGYEWVALGIVLILTTSIFAKYAPAAATISILGAEVGLTSLSLIYFRLQWHIKLQPSGWIFFIAGLSGIAMATGGILQISGMAFPRGKPPAEPAS